MKLNDHMKVPKYWVDEVGELEALKTRVDKFLTQRGDWRKLKEITGDGKGIKVGVGDTGVDTAHRNDDLAHVKDAKDFTGSRFDWADRNNHGSHVTCHIGGRNDQTGVIGVASSCDMYHAKVLGDSGSGSIRGIIQGGDWLAEQGCKIMNFSLGGGFSRDLDLACKRWDDAGILVFAAMGNSGTNGAGHPGTSEYTTGIVAIDYNRRLASFSSRSRMAVYSGYGVGVLSCITGNRYARLSGTSMATPDQVGLATLILSYAAKKNIQIDSRSSYYNFVKPFIEDLGSEGHDVGYGHGFINIWKLINHYEEVSPDPPTPPTPPTPCPPPSKPDMELIYKGERYLPGTKLVDGQIKATWVKQPI